MLSIKKFLKNTKGARNVKTESVFPDLQLFVYKNPKSGGEKDLLVKETARRR